MQGGILGIFMTLTGKGESVNFPSFLKWVFLLVSLFAAPQPSFVYRTIGIQFSQLMPRLGRRLLSNEAQFGSPQKGNRMWVLNVRDHFLFMRVNKS